MARSSDARALYPVLVHRKPLWLVCKRPYPLPRLNNNPLSLRATTSVAWRYWPRSGAALREIRRLAAITTPCRSSACCEARVSRRPWTTTRRAERSFANGWRFRRRSGKQQNRQPPLLRTPPSRMNSSAAGVTNTGLFRRSTVPWMQAGKIASQSRIERWSRPLPSGAASIGFRGLWM